MNRSARHRLLLPLLLAVLVPGCASLRDPLPVNQMHSQRPVYEFALIGDVPYTDDQATNSLPRMIRDINRHRLAFVVHDGDIKDGSSPCTDEVFQQRLDQFQTFLHPFILVFGDNEWTDCGNTNKQKGGLTHDPVERLRKLRDMFCAGPRTLGRRSFALARQSDLPAFAAYRENVRWNYGQILYVGLNLPGSGNNFGHAEFEERNRANLAWIRDAFTRATRENLRAIMIVIQANPQFDKKPADPARAGFNDFLKVLEEETLRFAKPVVLVHGDSHYFRIDKPMVGTRSKRRVENFTRVETFGYPDVHWLRVRVDWKDPNVFSFRQEIIPENRVIH